MDPKLKQKTPPPPKKKKKKDAHRQHSEETFPSNEVGAKLWFYIY